MWLYHFVRPIASWSLKWYLGRMDLINLDRIPKDKPVILAANHPTTFIEPCILACFQDRPLNFLARGDFFRIPFFSSFLRGVNIIPVFRLKDGGLQGVKNNFESFDHCYKALEKGKVVMILAEGRCIHEKRLRPIQKGPGRIALGAIENTSLEEVHIVPIGVNFTYADRFRSDVMLRVGEPMLASEYLDTFKKEPQTAIREFTTDLRKRLLEEVIHIDKISDENLLEGLSLIHRTEHPAEKGKITNSSTRLTGEKRIADYLNQAGEAEKEALSSQVNAYFHKLHTMRISDEALAGKLKKDQKKTTAIGLGLIPALILAIWHAPPWLLAQWISTTKITTVEFSSPVRWAAFTLFYLLYPLCWIIPAIVFKAWFWLIIPVVALLALPWLIGYVEQATRWLQAWRVRREPAHEVAFVKELRKQILVKAKMIWGEPS